MRTLHLVIDENFSATVPPTGERIGYYFAEIGTLSVLDGAAELYSGGALDTQSQLDYYIAECGLNYPRHAIDLVSFDGGKTYLDGCQFSNESLRQLLTACFHSTELAENYRRAAHQ